MAISLGRPAQVALSIENAPSVATDPAATATWSVFFKARPTFGAGEANETELEAVGDYDVFVAKYGVAERSGSMP